MLKLNSKEVLTRLQSVTCPFPIVTTLNIIDIAEELLRATRSGKLRSYVACAVHFRSPVVPKLLENILQWKELLKQ